MRYLITLVVLLVLAATAGTAFARTYASMVVDADTGQTLSADNADTAVYPASLTKIMTLYMLFDAIDEGRLTWTTPLRVSSQAAKMPPSKFGLRPGQTIKVRDAALGLVTKSANDVAVVVAEALAGSEAKFAQQMTQKARQLGMRSTTFRNASGLPDSQQKTTARDMIRLGLAIQREHPRHYRLFSTQRFKYRNTNYRNHNKLLSRYSGTDGIKTGYIRASGFNLLASVERNNRRLVAEVFGGRTGRSRDDHMIELLDRAFNRSQDIQVARLIPPSPRRPARTSAPVIAVASPEPAAPAEPPRAVAALTAVRGGSDFAGRLAAGQVPAARSGEAASTSSSSNAGAVPLRILISANKEEASATEPAVRMPAPTGPGDFGVQVGAFATRDLAQNIAAQVVDRAPRALASTEAEVSRVHGRLGTLYRARRVGLSQETAEEVCRILEQHRHPCMVFKTSG